MAQAPTSISCVSALVDGGPTSCAALSLHKERSSNIIVPYLAYILLTVLYAVAFISIYVVFGLFLLPGSGGLTITRMWHRLLVGPSASALATFMSLGLLLFGLSFGKLLSFHFP